MMQDINRNNYETYAIDYINGDLSLEDAALFKAFLDHHPDIEAEIKMFDMFENDEIEIDSENFKNSMKAELNTNNINAENFEELCIAYTEDDIHQKQKEALETYASGSQDRRKMLNTYKHLKLDDEEIIFPDKNLLKHQQNKRHHFIWYQSAAAIVLISLMLMTPKWGRHTEHHQTALDIENNDNKTPQTKEKETIIVADEITIDKKNESTQPINHYEAAIEKETDMPRTPIFVASVKSIKAGLLTSAPKAEITHPYEKEYRHSIETKYTYQLAMSKVYSPNRDPNETQKKANEKSVNFKKVIDGSLRIFEVIAETDMSKKQQKANENETFKEMFRKEINETLEIEESFALQTLEVE